MPTVKQQSFIGALWLNERPLNTLDALLGKAAWANRLPSLATLAPHLASTVRNDSHLLSCQAGVTHRPMAFYFQWSDQGYELYVRSPGKYFSRGLALDEAGFLGVMPVAQRPPALLSIHLWNGEPVATADTSSAFWVVTLAIAGEPITPCRRPYAGYQYLSPKPSAARPWKLRILERNVIAPWLS